jgi:signal transduction histidine kinase
MKKLVSVYVSWLQAVQKLFRSSRRVPVIKNGIKTPEFMTPSPVLTLCFTRIVDDLLTLSKLDSNLLQINQSPVRATSILDDMQRIFEIEAGRADIELRLEADPSIKEMNVDNVMLDTGRVHQILINLITNALKL